MSAPPPPPEANDYNADNIQVLPPLEYLRRRAALYLGSTDAVGLQRMVLILVDSALAEVRAGFCSRIAVVLNTDGAACVEDDGQGISVNRGHPDGRSLLELMFSEFCIPRVSRFPDGSVYGLFGGQPDPQMANALSEWLKVEVHRDGFAWRQTFARGRPTSPLVRGEPSNRTGTMVAFKPDPTIFSTTKFDYRTIADRLFEVACTNPGLRLGLFDLRSADQEFFHAANGIGAYLGRLVGQARPLTPVLRVSGQQEGVEFEAVLQYVDDDEERVVSFVNCHQTTHGTHVTGFRTGLARSFFNQETLIAEAGLEGSELAAPELRTGLRAVLTVNLPEPQWSSATRNHLNNPEVETVVTSITVRELSDFVSQHPEVGRALWRKAPESTRRRAAAQKARRRSRPVRRRRDSR